MEYKGAALLLCKENKSDYLFINQVPSGHFRVTNIKDNVHNHLAFVSERNLRQFVDKLVETLGFEMRYADEVEMFQRDIDLYQKKAAKLRKQVKALGEKPVA